MSDSVNSSRGIERGDRVEVRLHGSTTPNDAKGTVVDESPVSILTDPVLVRLDNSYRNCDNPYETSRSAVTKIGDRTQDAVTERSDSNV